MVETIEAIYSISQIGYIFQNHIVLRSTIFCNLDLLVKGVNGSENNTNAHLITQNIFLLLQEESV